MSSEAFSMFIKRHKLSLCVCQYVQRSRVFSKFSIWYILVNCHFYIAFFVGTLSIFVLCNMLPRISIHTYAHTHTHAYTQTLTSKSTGRKIEKFKYDIVMLNFYYNEHFLIFFMLFVDLNDEASTPFTKNFLLIFFSNN